MAEKPAPVDEMFDRYFQVRFSYFHSRTPEQLARTMRVTGDPTLDRGLENQMVDSFLNIDGIFKHFKLGATVYITHYKETAEIYRIVHTHLTIWKSYMSQALHGIPTELMEELIELDRFAAVVYDKAVSVFSDMEKERLKNPNIPYSQKFNYTNIFKNKPSGNVVDVTVDKQGKEQIVRDAVRAKTVTGLAERKGYQDLFAEHLNRTGDWRRNRG